MITDFISLSRDAREKLIRETITQSKTKNTDLNAVVRREDEWIENHIQEQLDKPLGWLPIIIKDNILLEGTINETCSKMLEGYVAPYTSTVLQKLIDQGALIIGKANMDEFAMGTTNETSIHGPAKNPHNTTKIAGGSSGGSAVAVASGMVPVALGTDTGGSVRQPASMTGVIWWKPSYGRYSRYGVIAMGSSFDQVGIFANTVEDVQTLDLMMAGEDSRDNTTTSSTSWQVVTSRDNIKIAVPKEYFSDALDPKIAALLHEKMESLREAGYEVEEVSLPLLEKGIAVYYTLIGAEVSTNMSRYDGVRYGYQGDTFGHESVADYITAMRSEGLGSEVKRRILTGAYVLNSSHYEGYYLRAQKVRRLLQQQVEAIFEDYDLILGPTSPEVARTIGEQSDDPLRLYLADLYTVIANLVWCPAISLPAGEVDGLPVGMQLMWPQGNDEMMLESVRALSHKL